MSTNDSPTGTALSLEAIVAFNDELEALVRAGIPLERGLMATSADYRGRLGRMLRDVAGRLEAGEGLASAVSTSASSMPDVYRAMIEAGTRSGRLAEALQGLSRIGQAHVEARRSIALALFYPLLVLVLTYALFLFFVAELFPRFFSALAMFQPGQSALFDAILRAGKTVWTWGAIPPLVLVGLILAWRFAGRSQSLDGYGRFGSEVERLPLLGRIMTSFRAANFTDLLGHLLEHEVPLAQSVRLAGAASGSATLRRDADRFADRLGLGATGQIDRSAPPSSFPPLVAWMLASTTRQSSLGAGLRHLAMSYRRKATRQAKAFRIFLPGFLILTLGAGAVLAYGLLLFIPLRAVWDGLATP